MKILRRKYALSELIAFSRHGLGLLRRPRKLCNLLASLLSAHLGLDRSLGLPAHVFVEVSGECNYECVKCARNHPRYRDDGPGPMGRIMTLARFESLLQEIGDTTITMRLWHYGEPLLNRDLPEMVRAAKGRGIFVALSTNGSLLGRELAKDLVLSGLDYLIVSFDAGTRQTYALVHGSDTFDKVIENLTELATIKRVFGRSNPFVDFQVIVYRQNEDEIHLAKEIGRRVRADKISLIRLDPRDANPDKVHKLGGISPANAAFRLQASDDMARCTLAWTEAVIRYSGTVIPCVSDIAQEHVMGRLFQDRGRPGFKEIWNGAAYCAFRRAVKNGAQEMCIGCTQRNNNARDQIE